jgi:hypothetical protein
MREHINSWITVLSTQQPTLDNMPVCPYARGSEFELIESDGGDINPPPWDFELIIYKLPDNYSVDELTNIATEYNNIFPEMIFLPDHKDRDTFINGVQTNNGKYNLILCQWRDNLEKARSKLSNTAYYSFWNEDYLKEILNT